VVKSSGTESLQGSVLVAMWRAHRRAFLIVGGIKLFDNVLVFASPLLLEQLLLGLQEGKSTGLPFVELFVTIMIFISGDIMISYTFIYIYKDN
jgi:hypothetical protein